MSISSDLISNILVRLPVKSLLRFQLLSKEWYGKIHGSSFVKNHLSTAANRDRIVFIKQQPDAKHPLDCCGVRFNEDDEFEGGLESIRQPHVTCVYFGRMHSTHIVGYCNGLVCLRHYSIACVIWNPLIRRYKELPPVPSKLPAGFTEKHAYDFNVVSWDFGYEPGENDYKVLRVVQFSRRSDASVNITAVVGELYSLRADSWKTVEDPWPKDCRLYNSVYPPLFNLISASLNGAVHWLVLTGRKDEIKSDLMVFNLATEKFRKYKIPVQLGEEGDLARLVVLRGCICMCTDVSVTAKEVWMMEEYGVDSWTRLYTIVLDEVRWGPRERVLESSSCKPSVYPKDGKKVLMEHHCDCLFWYDIEERRGTRVPLPGLGGFFCTVICVGNLALLDCDSVSILTDVSKIFCFNFLTDIVELKQ
jgi:F-box interacting protein